jgi:hypothetical protein
MDFPEKGTFVPGKTDPMTGARWVNVSPQMARAHPKGRLGPVLWLIVAFFVVSGVQLLWVGITAEGWVSVVIGMTSFLAGAMLALRAPWAVVMTGILLILLILSFVLMSTTPPVAELVLAILALSYLLEADRPNLIYRHRFRSYKEPDQ